MVKPYTSQKPLVEELREMMPKPLDPLLERYQRITASLRDAARRGQASYRTDSLNTVPLPSQTLDKKTREKFNALETLFSTQGLSVEPDWYEVNRPPSAGYAAGKSEWYVSLKISWE